MPIDYCLDPHQPVKATPPFEPFFRVDAARRKTMPGAGLGLAIAKEIIERFGGTISIANSTKPKGLVQTIRLPLTDG